VTLTLEVDGKMFHLNNESTSLRKISREVGSEEIFEDLFCSVLLRLR